MMAAATAETEYVMPETKTATPAQTPLSSIAGKVAAAVDAQKNGAADPILEIGRAGLVAQELGDTDAFAARAAEYDAALKAAGKGGVPFDAFVERIKKMATPAAPPAPAATTPAETKVRHKLIQVLLEDQPLFRDALVKAANDAQLSPAGWARMVLAEKLGVALPPPEKRASDPVAKATLAADKKLLELVLIRDHYKRIAATEPIIAPMATKADAAIASYVKKLGETVGAETAASILKSTEEKIAATRK